MVFIEAGGRDWDLLWTNASPLSAFAAQTLTLNGAQNYNMFMVVYRALTGSTMIPYCANIIYTPDTTSPQLMLTGVYGNGSGFSAGERELTFTKNAGSVSVEIKQGNNHNYNISSVNNDRCVPVYILGTIV